MKIADAFDQLIKIAKTGENTNQLESLCNTLVRPLRTSMRFITDIAFDLSDVVPDFKALSAKDQLITLISKLHEYGNPEYIDHLVFDLKRNRERLSNGNKNISGCLENLALEELKEIIDSGHERINDGHLFAVNVSSDDDRGYVALKAKSEPSDEKEAAKNALLLLLRAGANPQTKIGNPVVFENTILHTQISNMQFETAEAVVSAIKQYNAESTKKIHFETKDVQGKTALQMAVMAGSIPLVKLLLEADADPNSIDYHNSTALHKACCRGNLEMVKLLVEHGARLDIKDDKGLTPLDYADGDIKKVLDMLESINITPAKKYNAKRSFPIQLVKESEQLSYVCVYGKEGEVGFEGHTKVREYLLSLNAQKGQDIGLEDAKNDQTCNLLQHITHVSWRREIDPASNKVLYVTEQKVPYPDYRVGKMREGLKEAFGEEIAKGFRLHAGQKIAIEASALTHDVRNGLMFADKRDPVLNMQPTPFTKAAYETIVGGISAVGRYCGAWR